MDTPAWSKLGGRCIHRKITHLLAMTLGSLLLACFVQGCGGGAGGNGGDKTTTTSGGPVTPTTTATTTTTTSSWATLPGISCASSVTFAPGFPKMAQKGMAVDDVTIQQCADKFTGLWPHTNERVRSLRIFTAWKTKFGEGRRQQAWDSIEKFVKANQAQVLMGVGVSCNSQEDDKSWEWAKQLMKQLGKEHIMGVAIGNEIDNGDFDKWPQDPSMSCRPGFWTGGYFNMLESRVKELDAMGFTDTKITIVWSMGILSDQPFKGMCMDLLKKAYNTWKGRWAWTFNPYAIWDRSQFPTGRGDCHAKSQTVQKIDYTKRILATARQRIKALTKNDDDPMWVGETGWSSPAPNKPSQQGINGFCPEFFSMPVLAGFYKSVLEWDLTFDGGLRGPDWVFYFTMRDANGESFGLVSQCGSSACKYGPKGNGTLLVVA